MAVPTFNAESCGDELGASARSYLRQVDAWTKVTRLPQDQRALVLYQHLQGRAWIEAEELDVETLASPRHVRVPALGPRALPGDRGEQDRRGPNSVLQETETTAWANGPGVQLRL